MISHADRMVGVIVGTAVGDAIGLPTEGMSRRRVRRLARGPLRHRLLFGRGMASDDTEHTCMVAQALLASGGEPGRFARSLGWRLRWWLLGLPAGVGKATARAILKLWLGFPPARSGVRSAGNGPAMRAAVLGMYCRPAEGPRLAALVRESTRVTHTDPRAELGALAVAVAARYAADRQAGAIDPQEYLATLRAYTQDAELLHRVGIAATLAGRGTSLGELCAELGLSRGVSGFIYDTVPVALFCWLRWPSDYGAAVEAAVLAGGDTDTTAAVVGGLVGATVGEAGLPDEWVRGIAEWPRSVAWMRRLALRLAEARGGAASNGSGNGAAPGPLPLFWPALIVRNAAFFVVVLLHGFRRLLPPY